jgi:hypothetical protein
MDGLVGKKVTIFYDDLGSVSRKDGTLTTLTELDYILDNKIVIPRSRVIRVEVRE